MDILKMKSGATVDTADKFNKRREEIKKHLAKSVYGVIPSRPEHLSAEVVSDDQSFGGGIGVVRSLNLRLTIDGEVISLPMHSVVPNREGKFPTFIYIDYESCVPSKYLPAEEIVERGYAVFCISVSDVPEKLIKKLTPNKRRKDSPGKIAILSWLISRIADYAMHQSCVDGDNLAVIGHGLLARAALVAGGYDERFKYVILNNFEFGEKYLSRPELFAKRFYEGEDGCCDELALALCVPRTIMVGAAINDVISDCEKEMSALLALDEAYALFGKGGFACEVKTDEKMLAESDSISYHLREGVPYLSRRDWNVYMDYIDAKSRENNG